MLGGRAFSCSDCCKPAGLDGLFNIVTDGSKKPSSTPPNIINKAISCFAKKLFIGLFR